MILPATLFFVLDFAGIQGNLLLVLWGVLLIVKGFALFDAVVRPAGQFAVHDTLPKNAWLIILVLAFAAHLLFPSPLGILGLVGTVAALVYLAQLRGSSY